MPNNYPSLIEGFLYSSEEILSFFSERTEITPFFFLNTILVSWRSMRSFIRRMYYVIKCTRCLMVPPPNIINGKIDKNALFSNFLFLCTFACRTMKITFLCCKKFDKKLHTKLIFNFLTLKSHFLNLRFLHYVLRWKTEKKEGKMHFFFKFTKFYNFMLRLI